MQKGIIYKIVNPKGKIYIGKSKRSLEERYPYESCIKKGQRKLYNSVKKYGWDNHIKEVIEEVSFELLNEREVYWINFCDTYRNGLNCTFGGDGMTIMSDEMKEKISNSLKGKKTKPCSEETKKKIADSQKGISKPMSEETKKKIGLSLTGKSNPSKTKGIPRTEETKKRISSSNTGRILSEETKLKISSSQKGRIAWNKGLKIKQYN